MITFLLFPGCSPKTETSSINAPQEDDPVMTANDIEVIFSDSGRLQAKLTSPLLKRYLGETPCTEFPNGFKVYIFDSIRRVSSTISGNYGKRREFAHTMEARGNVVVRNELKKKQLNTEHLIWEEYKNLIYSDTKVRITEPGKILFGDGIQANESFTWYRIINPAGQIMVKKDSI